MSQFILPSTTRHGSQLMLEPEVQEIVRSLHEGHPGLGWAGDDRLGLYILADGRWELVRVDEAGMEHVVCRSRAGLALDNRLIMHLVAHDSRRVGAVGVEDVIRHNESLEAQKTAQAVEALAEPMDKMRHALVKANPGL